MRRRSRPTGIIPIGAGVKDGFFGEWYFVNSLTQNLDSAADALNLFIGELDWNDPKYHEHWVKLRELQDNGYINDDVTSLELYQGIQLFDTGKAAMCDQHDARAAELARASSARTTSATWSCPTFGTGAMAGKPITDTQGFGIPSKAARHADAPRRSSTSCTRRSACRRCGRRRSRSRPTRGSTRRVIDDPFLKAVYDTWFAGEHNVYIADLMPTLFWTDAMFVASQKILGRRDDRRRGGQARAPRSPRSGRSRTPTWSRTTRPGARTSADA